MLRLLVGILFISFAAEAQAEVKWGGGAGVRRLLITKDDGMNHKDSVGRDTSVTRDNRWEFRAALNASDKGESVDWGFGMRTQPNAASEWISVSNNSDLAIGLEQAYGRLHASFWDSEGSVTIGRQKTVLLYDNVSQILFDNDVRWDGFGWTWKMDSFGLNLAQYVLGATNRGTAAQTSSFTFTESSQSVADTRSRFGILFSFQPFYAWKVNEDITGKFALGYHNWSGTGGTSASGWYNNSVHGGTGAGSSTTESSITSVPMDNARQWQFLTDWSLPYSLHFVGEFVLNKKVVYGTRLNPTTLTADHNAWATSLVWGSPKKAGDFSLAYTYDVKGIASVVNTFTNGDVPIDNRSHLFEGKYMLADGVVLGGKLQLHREKANVDGAGVTPSGVDNGHHEKQNRYELYTNVIL